MATATARTTFDVPDVGRVTLVAGEPCPPAWEAHAPPGSLSAEGPLSPASAPAEPPPVTVSEAPAPKKK